MILKALTTAVYGCLKSYDTLKRMKFYSFAPRSLHITSFLFALALISFCLHIWLAQKLNIVEDESAYLQDAAQITWNFLPFREFGATKGPLFLILLKWWGMLFGQTITAGRLFAAVAHIGSIPLLFFLARNLSQRVTIAAIAAAWWALSPVVVSLTTNVTHIPWELFFILATLTILSSPSWQLKRAMPIAALLCLAALLTRATAIVFAPVVLYVLFLRAKSLKPVLWFAAYFLLYLLVLIAAIFPLYGWPKTAFFFNADATLIAQKQRVVYAASAQSASSLTALFMAALPVWRDSLPLLGAALLFPFAWRSAQPGLRIALTGAWLVLFSMFGRLVLRDQYWSGGDIATIVGQLVLGVWALLGVAIILKPNLRRPPNRPLVLLLLLWVASFVFFYRGWGRQPTPFYPLESIPAMALAAGVVTWYVVDGSRQLPRMLQKLVLGFLVVVLFVVTVVSYIRIPTQQYRGTVTVAAARAMAAYISQAVPMNEPLFTAQPIYAYLSYRPVYRGLTHPGWYLAERAGFLPAEIRAMYFPDFALLEQLVAREVNWIVADWRTTDVYFNGGTAQTAGFRELLSNKFEVIRVVPNPASRDITLYRRIDHLTR